MTSNFFNIGNQCFASDNQKSTDTACEQSSSTTLKTLKEEVDKQMAQIFGMSLEEYKKQESEYTTECTTIRVFQSKK